MDWTGYPIALPAEQLVTNLDDLAAFLGGDPYTRNVLTLVVAAADQPDTTELDRLVGAYPREVIAYGTWSTTNPTPTGAELAALLAVVPDPIVPDPAAPLTPLTIDRATLVRMSGDTSATAQLRYRTAPGQTWRTWQRTVPTPAVEIDGRLLTDGSLPARVSLMVTVDDNPPPVYRDAP